MKDMMRHSTSILEAQYRREIERAIDNVKRTPWDKWFRREWYKAGARRRWAMKKKSGRQAAAR